MEHSENRIITTLESEVGPGMLHSSVQQTFPCKNTRQLVQDQNMAGSLRFEPVTFLQSACLLNAGVGDSRSISFSNSPDCVNDFIFGMLYFRFSSVSLICLL